MLKWRMPRTVVAVVCGLELLSGCSHCSAHCRSSRLQTMGTSPASWRPKGSRVISSFFFVFRPYAGPRFFFLSSALVWGPLVGLA